METVYLPVAATAKLVRAALRKAFPGVTFTVRSKSYSGGCSVDVRWIDGPTAKAVDAVAGQFQGKRFDGSIDMAWTASLWLMPDGSAVVASDPGSSGSMGSYAPERNWMPDPAAKLISTGAYVFCSRELSPAFRARLGAFVERRGGYAAIWPARDFEQAVYMVSCRAQVVNGALMVQRER